MSAPPTTARTQTRDPQNHNGRPAYRTDRIDPPIQDGCQGLPHAGRIRKVSTAAPFGWLLAGWQDFRRAQTLGLAYGLLFSGISFAITVGLTLMDMSHLIGPMWGGFFIVGPALAIGMYQVSRRLERNEKPTLKDTLTAWRRNGYHVMTAGAILMLFMMIWVRIAAVIFALMFPFVTLSFESMLQQALFTPEGWGFLAFGSLVGAGFAGFAFVAAAVSLPAMLDRKIDIFSAVALSAVAVFRNPRPMFLWGAIIVTITGMGMATFYLGLAITLPLVGFASWHAYRDLYVNDDDLAAQTEPTSTEKATI